MRAKRLSWRQVTASQVRSSERRTRPSCERSPRVLCEPAHAHTRNRDAVGAHTQRNCGRTPLHHWCAAARGQSRRAFKRKIEEHKHKDGHEVIYRSPLFTCGDMKEAAECGQCSRAECGMSRRGEVAAVERAAGAACRGRHPQRRRCQGACKQARAQSLSARA